MTEMKQEKHILPDAIRNALSQSTLHPDEADHISSFSLEDERGLPPMPHPLKKAAVLVSLTNQNNQPSIILTRRAAHLTEHTGQIAFPGGKIDLKDKSATAAAIRETEEEIGIERKQITIIGKLPLYETVTGYSITPIVAELTPPYIFKRAKQEVDEIFELPFDFGMDLKKFRRDSLIYKGERREFWAIPYNDYYIWGATAAILRELATRINGK